MRLAGRITEWNDEKGFGFVVPNGRTERAFVHVNAFQRGSRRPAAGDLISYVAVEDRRGRLSAREIRHAGQKPAVPRTPSRLPRALLGAVGLGSAVALGFAGVIPPVVVAALSGFSALAYLLCWLDKSAARSGAPRIPENTLHLLGLAGGWPGALIAQQRFRHKTIKQPFQTVFWITAILNIAGVAWLATSESVAQLLQTLGS
jgi:uncharacterized membrane protein YsdA (DUF1294 family)/cold shock CspA family protein